MRWIVRALVRGILLWRWQLTGKGNFPRSGPAIACSNHVGNLDPPLVPGFLPRGDTWSMAKAEHFQKPFRRWLFSSYHAFPVVRHSADRQAIRRAMNLLTDGHVLVLYPEGTRIVEGGLHRPEAGAGFLAQLSQAPVVPIGLVGTREVMPKGKILPRPHPIQMHIGRPFRVPAKTADGKRIDNRAAADAIMLSIAELLPEDLRGEYADLEQWRQKVGGLRDYGVEQAPAPGDRREAEALKDRP